MRPSQIQAVGLALLWGLGAVTMLAWAQAADPADWRQWLAAAAAGAAAIIALMAASRVTPGTLVWDGQQWRFEPLDGASASPCNLTGVHVALDLQFVILAELMPEAGQARWRQNWIWLERRQNPAAWKPLRRALVANGRPVEADAVDSWQSGNHNGGNRQKSAHERL